MKRVADSSTCLDHSFLKMPLATNLLVAKRLLNLVFHPTLHTGRSGTPKIRHIFVICNFWAGVSFPPSFWKFYRNNFAAYTDTRIRMKILSFYSSSTGMLQVNQDKGIQGPLFGFQDKNLPEKPDTFLHGNTRIQGYQTLCRGYRTKIRDQAA